MSQRLYIGETTEENIYDCILKNSDGAEDKIKKDWLAMGEGFYLGPWKIIIGNKKLFFEIESIIYKVFVTIGETYPDCIWTFYDGSREIEHPTRDELDKFLNTEVI